MKKRKMLANKETAMRLWASRYGKTQRVRDYAGRMMDRAAYGDRGSQYGWNLDHIFPQSKGGKTADHNLVCCHILTNDEKADKICFTANGQRFQVIKVENHYEIAPLGEGGKVDREPNFYDSAYGSERLQELISDPKERYSAEVLIDLIDLKNAVLYDFIGDLLGVQDIHLVLRRDHPLNRRILFARFIGPRSKEFAQAILDKCLLLNTYFKYLILPGKYVSFYDIYFSLAKLGGEEGYDNGVPAPGTFPDSHHSDHLYVTDAVIEGIGIVRNPIDQQIGGGIKIAFFGKSYTEYDHCSPNLAKNLAKGVNKGE